MAAPSKVDIANMALLRLGHTTITSFDEDSEHARVLKLMFDQTVDEVLGAGRWRFATKQAALAKLGSSPLWRYQNRYQLPADPFCLWVTRVNADEDGNSWEVQGRELLTDQDPVLIEYVARIENAGEWDPLFVGALVEKLAAEMAIAITQQPSLRQTLLQTYLLKLQDAVAKGSMEGTPELLTDTTLIDIR